MRRRSCSKSTCLAAFVLFAGITSRMGAQGPAPDTETPERGVARISVIDGDVSVRRGDSGDWVAAAVNAPLLVDDRISSGPRSRAEVQFDAANLIRIGANAEIRLAQLEYGRYTLQVAHGTVTFRVLRNSQDHVEIETPNIAVRPSHAGSYRIYVQEDGQTELTVRAGDVQVFTPRGSQTLQAGQTMLVRGDPSDPEFRIVPAISLDEWDRWNTQRDQELERSASYRYMPQGVYGSEDLDNSGRWVDVPEYGDVWAPTVGPDWAPYQNGSWVWEDWYGWTWVSYDPWGWAPYHWGRWFWARPYGWCWWPGGVGVHYWSPALVAFFGFGGGGFGAGFGFGNIGWVPLAPFEPFHPWWGRGIYGDFRGGYLNRNINVANVDITNVYRNARVANGVTTVSAADFRQGRFTNISRVSGAQIRNVGVVRGALPVAPERSNLRFSDRAASYVPRGRENVKFFSRSQVPAVQRVPFAQQQRTMQQYSRQPLGRESPGLIPRGSSSPVQTQQNTGWRSFGRPSAANTQSAAGTNPGWRPVNQTAAQPAYRGGTGGTSLDRGSGWQRFGEPRSAPRSNSWDSRGESQAGAAQSRTANPSYSAPRYPSGNQPESIRIAPPVVRERSAPRNSPNYSAPSHSGARSGGYAPRSGGGGYTPRSGGGSRGGGGGPSRGGGGGGGGSHGGRR